MFDSVHHAWFTCTMHVLHPGDQPCGNSGAGPGHCKLERLAGGMSGHGPARAELRFRVCQARTYEPPAVVFWGILCGFVTVDSGEEPDKAPQRHIDLLALDPR